MKPFWEIGGLTLSVYTVFVDLAILLGLSVTYLIARWRKANPWKTIDAALIGLASGVIGGRIAYVAVHWVYFSSHLREALYLWRGGLSFQGGLIAGALGLIGYCLWVERPFWPLADLLVPGLALGEAVGWVGCLGSGCGYGLPARGPWAYELPDIYGIVVPRFPTQALASLASGLIFALLIFLLWRYRSRLAPGFLTALYLLLSALGHFLVEFARGDETLYLGLLRWSQWAEAGEAILAISILTYLWQSSRGRRVREPL